MRFRLSQDARPQAMTLLVAATISVVLWFIPYAEILTYPFRIFVTFIHEGGHAIAALLTGNSVASLSVAPNASGETYTTYGGLFSQTLISSAGYIGAMSFGALLLVLIRKAIQARIVLLASGVLIFALTMIFSLITRNGTVCSLPAAAGSMYTGGRVPNARRKRTSARAQAAFALRSLFGSRLI